VVVFLGSCSETQTLLRSFEDSKWSNMTENTCLTHTSFYSLCPNPLIGMMRNSPYPCTCRRFFIHFFPLYDFLNQAVNDTCGF
jgi:hypothetical protein